MITRGRDNSSRTALREPEVAKAAARRGARELPQFVLALVAFRADQNQQRRVGHLGESARGAQCPPCGRHIAQNDRDRPRPFQAGSCGERGGRRRVSDDEQPDGRNRCA